MEYNVLLFLGLAVIVAFYIGKLAGMLRLPTIIGYLLVGMVLGPSVLHLISADGLETISFIIDIGLGLVAFSIGMELDFTSLRRLGLGIISVILAESFGAFLVVFAFVYLFSDDLVLSVLFAAIAPASAPAGTVAVIKEYKTKGPITKALYAVVGFDDALGIIIFGFSLAFAKALILSHSNGGTLTLDLWPPLLEITLSIIAGVLFGWLFTYLGERLRQRGEILVLLVATVLSLTGLSLQYHSSVILTNMTAGILLTNLSHRSAIQNVRITMDMVLPLLFVLFFLVAGLHLQVALLPTLGSLGLIYIAGRSIGLIAGAYLGSLLGGMDERIRHYIGLGILSQAGLAIGLGFMAKSELTKFATEHHLADITSLGTSILVTITATSIFFELVGPVSTRYALSKAGEIETTIYKKERR